MAGIFDTKFSGEFPRVRPEDLPAGAASFARDCDFRYGDLRPLMEDGPALPVLATQNMPQADVTPEARASLRKLAYPNHVGGLYYRPETNAVVCFEKPTWIARHTTNGLDRLFGCDGTSSASTTGVDFPVLRQDLHASHAKGDFTPIQNRPPRLFYFDINSKIGPLGPEAPSDTKGTECTVMGDEALSKYVLKEGSKDYNLALKYGIELYYATVDAKGNIGPFVAAFGGTYPDTVIWEDNRPSGWPATTTAAYETWVKDNGFYNKKRKFTGFKQAEKDGDIVFMAKILSTVKGPGYAKVGDSVKTTLVGLVYSDNYTGTGGTNMVDAKTGEITPTPTTAPEGAVTYPTVKEFPELDTWGKYDLEAARDRATFLKTMGYDTGDVNSARDVALGEAAQKVLDARSRTANPASQQSVGTATESVVASNPTGASNLKSLEFGHKLSLKVAVTKHEDVGSLTRYAISGTLQIGEIESRSYCYTYVNGLGEESSPSAPSKIINVDAGHCVRVSVDPPGEWCIPDSYWNTKGTKEGKDIQAIRIYRTVTGSNGATQFYLFKEVTLEKYVASIQYRGTTHYDIARPSDTSFYWFDWVDGLESKDAQEALSTIGHRLPPSSITHIQPYANGSLCAINGKEVLVSADNKPYAWPVKRRTTLNATILAAKTLSNGLLLGTEDGFAVVSGDPEGMTIHNIPASSVMTFREFRQAGDSLIALTTDGIAMINGSQVSTNLSEQLWTSAQWSEWTSKNGYIGEVKSFEVHNKQLLIFGTNSSVMIDLVTGGMTRLGQSMTHTASCYAPSLDAVFTAAQDPADGSYALVRRLFGGASARTYYYKSKTYRFPRPLNLGAAKVVTDVASYSGQGTIKVYGIRKDGKDGTGGAGLEEGSLVGTYTVYPARTNREDFAQYENYFRLKAGALFTNYFYTIEGTLPIIEVHIAETMAELQNA